MKWKSALEVLCDCKMPIKLRGNFFFFKNAIQPAMLYGTECWAVKKQYIHKIIK